ncbi:MAG: hypothetical protein KDI79_01760 [Anaerolineae bacterium]|nr:hypothetical protein [Anaerolineae bacterium]
MKLRALSPWADTPDAQIMRVNREEKMAIHDVLITLSVIGAVFVMGVVIVAFLKQRDRLRKSMVTANLVKDE